MFVVHNFSPNHSGCEQFSCECVTTNEGRRSRKRPGRSHLNPLDFPFTDGACGDNSRHLRPVERRAMGDPGFHYDQSGGSRGGDGSARNAGSRRRGPHGQSGCAVLVPGKGRDCTHRLQDILRLRIDLRPALVCFRRCGVYFLAVLAGR
jgi:hypothetical protein